MSNSDFFTSPPRSLRLWIVIFCALLTPFERATAQAALDPTKDKILYEVATAHLDTQWNWTIQQTINNYIPNTLHSNFTLFASYPNYTFTFEGAFRYQLVKEYYPDDYATLKDYMAQGRWHVGGSAIDAGDVNLPSPESLIRQVLYANNFWRQEFGKTSVDFFLPDCFGFGYALPSIGAHCGLKGFSSQKLSWGSAIAIPFKNIGRWIGPDGNSLVAALQPGAYVSTITANLANDASELVRMTNNFNQTGLYLDYRYVGTGDTGGSPPEASVNWLEQSIATTNGAIKVISACSDQMFRDLTPAQINLLPTFQGELLMSTHGAGCYTAHPEMKQYNRRNELGADAAERSAVVADWLSGGGTYPQEKLTKAWERFLWHQFHDDLTGTSLPAAYTFSWNDELLSLNEFHAVEREGMGILAQALDTAAEGVALVVYNPLSIAREDLVEATVKFTNSLPAAVRVYDGNGAEVPSQSGVAVGDSLPITFLAAVPANGVAVFDVRPAAAASTLSTGLSATTSQLENARYRVQINAAGDVASVYDKQNSRELLSAPIRWAFFADPSITWPSWEIMYSSTTAQPLSYLGSTPIIKIDESGPARVALSITRGNASSSFTERLRLAAGAGGDRLEWDVFANWGSAGTLLKVAFPLAVTNSQATYDLGLGTMKRPNATSSLYEVPAQQWVDLTASNAAFGITIMNDSRYGWDKPNNNTMRMTVFHTPAVDTRYTYQATDGFGSHQFGFAIMGHTNDWRSGQSPWVAARFNQPLRAYQTPAHAGTLGKSFSFLTCNNSNVMVKAIKKAENSNEIVVRLQELSGTAQVAQLQFAANITAARQITGAEDSIATLSPANGKLDVSLGGYAPVTLAFTIATPASPVTAPASLPLTLPYNLDAISTDASRTDGNFDGGYTYPAELLPATIVRDGITFQLGSTNNGLANCVSCLGQTISLPAGYDHLYLLAAAASNDLTAPFTLAGQSTNLHVAYFSDFIGQWNPPALKKDEVGWVCTHRHTAAGTNDAYRFCYLFKYCLALPPGATTLTLPNSPNIRIFAASLGRNTTADTIAVGGPGAENQLPWAEAGLDRTVNTGSAGTATVVLDATGSADPDGQIISYTWSTNGVQLASGAKNTISLSAGTYDFVLTVTDNEGGISQDVTEVTVLPALNVVILASATNVSTLPFAISFDVSVSGGGTILPADTTDNLTGTITAQGEHATNETAVKAFDNSTATKWLDYATNYPSTRASWLQYQYTNGLQQVVSNYTITSANDAPERDPAAWHLLGSNDGGTNWATLDVRTNQTFNSRLLTQTYSVSNPALYNVYRLQIDKVATPGSANSVQLSEFELLGAPVQLYYWKFGDGTTATVQNPQHTYTNSGNFRVELAVSQGIYTGTNSVLITIGAPLTVAASLSASTGAAPFTVQFSAQAAGGNASRAPYDTTDDQAGTIAFQGEHAVNTAAHAFDNSVTTKWLDYANAYPDTRSSWIQYQYANDMQCVLTGYTVTSANDATTYPARNPKDWRLLGSADNGQTWTTLDQQTGQTFATNYQKRSYSFTNTQAYSLCRFTVDSVSNAPSANCMQLAELEFMGRPGYTYHWSFGDGSTSSEKNPQHTFVNQGNYPVALVVSDGTATATANFTVTVLPLQLSVGSAGNGNLDLTWPAWATGYHLYSTTSLVSPIQWTLAPATVTQAGSVYSASISPTNGARFFRLALP